MDAKADVSDQINAVLRDSYLAKVKVGIKIMRLGPDKPVGVVYEKESTHPLVPASNLKLITTAAALDGLGADFVFKTKLLQKGDTIALVGDGDPSLGDAEALEGTGWRSTTLFEKWAEGLSGRGVKSAAKLLYDNSIFDDKFQHPNWPEDQLHKRYVAGVAGLNFNANCLDFYLKPKGIGQTVDYSVDPTTTYAPIANTCVGGKKNAVWLSRMPDSNKIELRGQIDVANIKPISVTVENPPLMTATVLGDVFKKAGIALPTEVTRDTTIRTNEDGWTPLAVYETPISHIIARANKDSMNLYAEALCKRLGAKTGNEPGSWKNGPAAVGAFLQSIGIDDKQFSLDDGCGLSKHNVISPGGIVAVLEHEFYARHKDVYLASLSVAGADGTLKERFAGSSLQERVIGKSGFVNGVSSLSGFLRAKDGSTFVFSIMFNGIAEGTNSRAKVLQEKIVQALD
ncbi:MAG: D-alanyl-D-alanine carboxypeptidase/D-alanyl-D-alanine-endopeptidase [Tepidisphaeraceae bacterium]